MLSIFVGLSMSGISACAQRDTNETIRKSGGAEPAITAAVLGVKKEYLDAAFDEMKTKYGTIENYFAEALGIDADQQKALRNLYLAQR